MTISRTFFRTRPLVALALWVPLAGGREVHGLTGVPAPPPAAALAQPAALPDSQAGRCVAAFLDLIRDPEPPRVEAFESRYRSPKRLGEIPMVERIRRVREVRDRVGQLTLLEVTAVAPDAIGIVVTSDRGDAIEMEFLFDSAQGGKLDGIRISMGAGAGVRPESLTDGGRSELVEAVAGAVSDHYVYPELGRKMAEAVRANLESGAYDGIGDDAAMCRRLTADLRAVSSDRHLGVRPEPREADRKDGPGVDEIAGDNFGFRKVEILPGNVGYVRLDALVGSDDAYATAAAALAFVVHCDALIFDLRQNGGGDPESIRFISSYLFDGPTHLNDMVDRSGNVVEEFWTLETVPGRRFAPDLPVFVLTSSYTFSGAEEFCYNLQNLNRAAVVGERTGGGAHPVRGVRVSDRVVVGVPYMRACNPVSRTNWEGVGIQPDVVTSADEALDRAMQLAAEAIQAGRAAARRQAG